MNQRGILIVVSGFSGAGKGTLMKELMKRYEKLMHFLFLPPHEIQEKEKWTEGNIFSKQPKNLKK